MVRVRAGGAAVGHRQADSGLSEQLPTRPEITRARLPRPCSMEANSVWNYVASGASAIVVSSLFNGLEVVRTRQINDGTSYATDKAPQYGNFWASLAKIIREEGLLGCWWPGMTSAWLREAVYGSLKLGLYPSIRDVLGGQRAEESSLLAKIASSAITGAIAQVLSSPLGPSPLLLRPPHPTRPTPGISPLSWARDLLRSALAADLVKMQLQAESGRVEQGTFVTGLRKGAPPRITGVFDALAQIYRREGVAGLWRGVLANVMRSTLLVRASASRRPFSLGCVAHTDGAASQVCGQLTGYGERFLLTGRPPS